MPKKLLIFTIVLVTCVVWQRLYAWRGHYRKGLEYWQGLFSHMLLVGVGNLCIRAVQTLGVGTSLFLVDLNSPIQLKQLIQNPLFSTLLSIVLLDFAIYWQHRLAHAVPILWRFHMVHHADKQMEATSGIRFHPVEIVFSFYYKLLICWFFGVTVEDYLLFEFILMSSAIFNHSNLDLPKLLEKPLALLCVTPRVHFVHHSISSENMQKNFGFFLSLWDRLFGSFKQLPEETLLTMELGVEQSNPVGIIQLLKEPFRK
jgi:sterol desaturase/sphingolipid hydroxylase (fatty acid hydroxylase superfamily)